LLIILVLLIAPSVFACRECVTDCRMAPPPTLGCQFTQDGCTDGFVGCPSLAESPVALWTIVAVDVTHSNPIELPSHQRTEPVVASATAVAHDTAPAPISAKR
jgi:hypothetical protein